MNAVEKTFFISRLTLVLSLGFAALLVRDYLRWKMQQEEETNQLTSRVERFLKATHLQSLVKPEDQRVVDQISKGWSNASYADGIKKATWLELISGLRR